MSVLWGNMKHIDNFYCFDVIQRVPLLQLPNYSGYQHFLYDTITNLRKKGMSFGKIALWLNKKGHKTPRGKVFKGTHVHSIVKKRRIRDEKLANKYPEVRTNFKLLIVDKTLVNQT